MRLRTRADLRNLSEWGTTPVRIVWRDQADDWHYFRLISVDEAAMMIRIEGMDDPVSRAKHDGDQFWVMADDIATIEKRKDTP